MKYYELIEARIVDLLEKFKLAVCKKLDTDEQIEELASAIDERAVDSKVTAADLRELMEDQRGIVVRNALYDQLSGFFDLDRSGQIYIGSFCSYLRDPTISHFNFFKVNPNVITN